LQKLLNKLQRPSACVPAHSTVSNLTKPCCSCTCSRQRTGIQSPHTPLLSPLDPVVRTFLFWIPLLGHFFSWVFFSINEERQQ
jgi:hypothetical protein